MDKSLFDLFYRIENYHWWCLGRKEIIHFLLKKYVKNKRNKILDIGCGTGGMLEMLKEFGDVKGVDVSTDAIKFSRKYFKNAIFKGRLPNEIPFQNSSFDLISLLDVLEHTEDDLKSLKKVYDLLKDKGVLVLTVPAYKLLWNDLDLMSGHKRRYVSLNLKKKVQKAGFKVQKISYFNSLLFPIVALIKRFKKGDPKSEFLLLPPTINSLLKKIFSIEKYIILKSRIPFGASIILIAKK